MIVWRRQLRPLAWFALVATLALALLPTLSHALALARAGSTWSEVCTPQGPRLVALDAASEPRHRVPAPTAGGLGHCPLCALAGTTLAPPPAPQRFALACAAFSPAGVPASRIPIRLLTWRGAQPRAPPPAA